MKLRELWTACQYHYKIGAACSQRCTRRLRAMHFESTYEASLSACTAWDEKPTRTPYIHKVRLRSVDSSTHVLAVSGMRCQCVIFDVLLPPMVGLSRFEMHM